MAVAENNCALESSWEWLQQVAHGMNAKTTRASALMLLNAILMGVVVFIGAYAPRYRRHPVIGALFVGAITLFLPIVSIIVTTVDGVHNLIHSLSEKIHCYDTPHLFLVFVWTGVVVVIGINASEVVAGDAREGRNIAPPTMLLVKAIWSAYLTFSTMWDSDIRSVVVVFLGQLFVIMFAKLVLKYAAFYTAQRSFAFGRNPRLITGYMAELKLQPQQLVPAAACPALIVMGEDRVRVEQQPHDYNLKLMPRPSTSSSRSQRDTTSTSTRATKNGSGLVTLDRVLMCDIPISDKDLCFSLALFKLLRCRFAKYTVSEAGFVKTSKFFREALLEGDHHHFGRVFGIITDELSFINEYYYSSLPIYYSHPLLPALGITLSLWVIGYCLFFIVEFQGEIFGGQISCTPPGCADNGSYNLDSLFGMDMGSLNYDAVPLYIVLAVLVLAETREVVSYICSNWTKVALVYHHVNQACWQRSRVVQKCIRCLFKYRRCNKLLNNWDDKMRQCSILVLHHRPRRTLALLLRHLLPRLRQKKVKVTGAVKEAIFEALKRESSFTCSEDDDGALCWRIRPPSSPVSVSRLYACNYGARRRPAYTMLVWHIATSVFEVNQQQQQQPPQPSPSDHKTVATHLSRYCAYLVSSCPKLLPDDAEWCHSLYNEVKKNADHVLAKPVVQHDQLVQALSADSNHEVLRNGARLGKELVDSRMGWEELARFWSEMILYVAPSENLEGHAEAISHGGELITLLWALLAHAGIVDRLRADAVATANEEPGSHIRV